VEHLAPHDLLRLCRPGDIESPVRTPAWVTAALAQAPWVVVRRAAWDGGRVPIGVRGRTRPERFAAYLPPAAVAEWVGPEQLAREYAWRRSDRLTDAAVSALEHAAALFEPLSLTWGPVGSYGFELATDVPTVTPTSDLDLVIRAPRPLSLDTAQRLWAALSTAPFRMDVQIETPFGAVALAEYARAQPPMLLRAAAGPHLVVNPWNNDVLTGNCR
jgi:phosphoribosyl-dephospho-CoA transferase